ncbi:MAG: hypothetical protein ACRDWA_01625 [Acidimicrobiia bacterium]
MERFVVIAAIVVLGGCGGESLATAAAPVIDPGDGGIYQPVVDPSRFGGVIDNPYLPLAEGARWVYEGTSVGETERVEVMVTGETREVMGVVTTVVRDTVTVGGELVEDTFDWFAQDDEGNVWYFGEDVKNYENGVFVDKSGSWEAGVDGALPGIIMLANPEIGEAYRQEFYEGEAEDMAEVIEVDGSLAVPSGSFEMVLRTRDWTPLEPAVIEEKSYAPGVGLIGETKPGTDDVVELVEFSR